MTSNLPTTIDSLSPSEQQALKASVFQKLHPRVYLERFLAENVRPDGRAFDAWRDISVNVGAISTADGSALVRLGKTTVVCGVKAEIAEPELDHEGEGFLVPNLDLPAMCSPKFKPGPPGEEAQILSEKLNDILLDSGILELDTLCIHPAKSAWTLYVDATCINYDGNVFDAALLAMVAALKDTRLPKATYNPDTNLTTCSRTEKNSLSLVTDVAPTSFSFGVFDASTLLYDPTAFEEPLLSSTLFVIVDGQGRMLSVSQLGLGLESLDDTIAVVGDRQNKKDQLLPSCIAAAISRWRAAVAKYIEV